MKRKILSMAAAAAVAAALTACGTPGDQSTPAPVSAAGAAATGPKPTIVLLHGAFEDASSWNQVVKRLQAESYPVFAPAVPLRGVAADVSSVEGAIDAIPGPKILVAHSYGGLLISELASRTPDVTALVFVAAFIPQAGETAGQLNSQFPGSLIGPDTTHAVSGPDGPGLYVNTESFAQLFADGLPAPDSAVSAAGQRPILASAFDEEITSTAPANIRKYAIVATRDKAISPEAERFEAQRAHAAITEVESPHAVPAANPQAVVDVIHQAAATQG
ncbi:pimeloyl-ACP methyl ester carboxylesterase [Pseudonocardia hierapolitana]|uniref:Pimeloyl-ACP methyl ester carboxylesterase n=1 Tax=Pseudonocardia hierapolitana TaxID=1128676 RepID=A0A561SI57_9PSEU|nr:alpha/beta hydrolase [Pseudonocardia hierapolitana]TWF74578.1 pimeloyl-ACP methyl ester carboxylesterase [Pseudonocardia hierapolitana]